MSNNTKYPIQNTNRQESVGPPSRNTRINFNGDSFIFNRFNPNPDDFWTEIHTRSFRRRGHEIEKGSKTET